MPQWIAIATVVIPHFFSQPEQPVQLRRETPEYLYWAGIPVWAYRHVVLSTSDIDASRGRRR